eukprot:866842-Rhodomonas_salina.1
MSVICLRACYAMSAMCLRARYAMSGTEREGAVVPGLCRASRRSYHSEVSCFGVCCYALCATRCPVMRRGMVLRVSGTEMGYGATHRR